jgi:uncharacterized membrane protein
MAKAGFRPMHYERPAPDWQPRSNREQYDSSGQRTFEYDHEERHARALGWFSIGLGLTEFAAPQSVARLIGLDDDRRLVRFLGIREIASGIGILASRRPARWLWTRVAGDIMDLTLLGAAFGSPNADRRKLTAATAAVAAATVLDVRCSQQLSRGAALTGPARVTKSITINRPPEDVYRFWRDLQNLPLFMYHLESVAVTDEKRSHWVAKAPAGMKVKWDAEIIEDRPNELIAWRSLEGSDVDNSGSVRFERAPGGRGTVLRVEIQYCPPAGATGAAVAKLFGEEPAQQVEEDLRRLKQVIETGEILTTRGQPAGRPRSTSWKYDQTVRPAVNSPSDETTRGNLNES